MSLQEDRHKGDEAQRLLDNALLKEAFEFIEANIKEKWESTKSVDSDVRELLYMQIKSIKEVRRYLNLIITHGKQAAKKIEDENGKPRR